MNDTIRLANISQARHHSHYIPT